MTAGRSINYDALTQAALIGVVRNVLIQVAKSGVLPGDHHFYIAFDTQAPGVVLSRRLKEKYPEEMMIVLQHRFWDLAVTEESFEVKLTFDGIPERLSVPFSALRVFFDPSVRFTLQFGDAPAAGDTPESVQGGRRRGGDAADGDRRNAGQRSAADRRRPRSRADKAPEVERADVAGTEPNAPAAFIPRPPDIQPRQEASASAAAPDDSEASTKTVVPAGGAKVFSLDQFRKK